MDSKGIRDRLLLLRRIQRAQFDLEFDFDLGSGLGEPQLDESLRGATISLNIAADRILEVLIHHVPCKACNGTGGWEDAGPNEGCAEFAPSQFIVCDVCNGSGYDDIAALGVGNDDDEV